MAKYSVEYRTGQRTSGDPDRIDYSDDRDALEAAARSGTQRSFDGRPLPIWVLYERVDTKLGEEKNWKEIASNSN